ncbi:MAG: hypothetical protein MI922_24285, partial [Bacteroidales bacterium]|nr:hypothetical protein [Bacteroidales bacterium]
MYKLRVDLFQEQCYIEFVNHQDGIIRYFTLNDEKEGAKLSNTRIKFRAQKGIKPDNISNLDYLEGFMDIHVFSRKSVELFKDEMSNEVSFAPCTVFCHGKEFEFYIAKILKNEDLVNIELSNYSTFSDGVKKLSKPVIKSNTNFKYIARDINEPLVSIVTQNFKKLV